MVNFQACKPEHFGWKAKIGYMQHEKREAIRSVMMEGIHQANFEIFKKKKIFPTVAYSTPSSSYRRLSDAWICRLRDAYVREVSVKRRL